MNIYFSGGKNENCKYRKKDFVSYPDLGDAFIRYKRICHRDFG